jgi:hypothetical protein
MDSIKYMCLDLTKKYLTAALDYLEYMKIPLALFPEWIKSNTIWMFMPEILCFLGDQMSCVGTLPSRGFGQQTLAEKTRPPWVLLMCQHPRALET